MAIHYHPTQQEKLALDAFIKLTRATDSLQSRLAQKGTQGDLTPTQFGVLETLYHLGTMCQSELGAKLLKSGGNITLVIDNLEKRSFVKRKRDEIDRRMINISLTDEGQELIGELLPQHLSSIMEEMSILKPEELEILGRLCRKLGKQE